MSYGRVVVFMPLLKYFAPWVVYSFECDLLGRILIQSDTRTGFRYDNIIWHECMFVSSESMDDRKHIFQYYLLRNCICFWYWPDAYIILDKLRCSLEIIYVISVII